MLRRILLLAALLVGCKGSDGATGPAGPAGPVGAVGPAGAAATTNRAELSGVIPANGTVNAGLPAAAVAGSKLPVIGCWVSDVGATWLQVADTPGSVSETYCGLNGIGTASPAITLVNGTPGWRFYLVAMW